MPSNLFIPVFFWHSTPEHNVTSSIISVDHERIVTGSNCGILCFWSLNSENYDIKPIILTIGGDKSPIVGLELCLFDSKECLISVSHSGTVAIWSFIDGVCLFSKSRVLTCYPKNIKVLPDGEHVAVSGESNLVEILNVNTLKIVRTINCDDWIAHFDHIFKEKEAFIMTISIKHVLSLWIIPKDLEDTKNTDVPSREIKLEIEGTVVLCSLSPSGKHLMILTDIECLIYSTKRFLKKLSIKASEYSYRCGVWCDDYTMILWTADSEGFVFQIDRKKTRQAKPELKSKNSKRRSKALPIPFSPEESRKSVLFNSRSDPRNQNKSDIIGKKESKIQYSGYSLVNKLCLPSLQSYRFISGGCDNGLAYVYTENDGLLLWNLLDEVFELPHVSHSLLSSGFTSISNKQSIKLSVTYSIISEKDLYIMRGYEDGSISIGKLPADSSPLLWKAHLGEITCLILLKGKHHDVLISGSSDMSIKIWDLSHNNPNLLFTFYNHCGAIRSLFIPNYSDSTSQWHNKFFSVSDDNTVGLFQSDGSPHCINTYGPHPSKISIVKWRPDQDYLLVYCEDGYLYVWEMMSGKLDSKFRGIDGKDILLNAIHLSHETKDGRLKNISHHPLVSISTTIDNQSLQSLIINTKLLSKDLDNRLHQERTSYSQLTKLHRSGMYKSCTYLLPWGVNPDLDKYAISVLHLRPPNPSVSHGILGYGRTMSILVPNASVGSGRWKISYLMSSYQSLASTTISKFLVEFDETCSSLSSEDSNSKKVKTFQLSTYFSTKLPSEVEDFLNPSLPVLAAFWQDTTKELMQSARVIFTVSIDRLSKEQQSVLAQTWCNALKHSQSPKTKSQAVLVLGILGYEYPYALTPDISNQVTIELLDLIDSNNNPKMKIIATELFAQGFKVWNNHTTLNINHIIQKLFKLSAAIEPKNLSKTAKSALMLIGSSDPQRFIHAISTRFENLIKSGTSNGNSLKVHAQVLITLHRLVKKYYVQFFSELPVIIESIVKSLHPHIPKLRDNTLKPVTSFLQELVERYPMVSFDKTEQRLGYGTTDGKVIIYDLNAAAKIYKINCHHSSITALSFSGSGKQFSTFSVDESTLKLWKPPTSIFGIIGGTPQCFKTIEIPIKNKVPSEDKEILDSVKIIWITPKQIKLMRKWEDGSLSDQVYTV